jgi:hypothetical protein
MVPILPPHPRRAVLVSEQRPLQMGNSGSYSVATDATPEGAQRSWFRRAQPWVGTGCKRQAPAISPAVAYSVRKNWIRSCFSWLVKLMLNRLL